MEVSVTAGALATEICKRLGGAYTEFKEPSSPTRTRVIELARVCGAIHDLGNPPFGHAGEQAIRSWFHQHEGILGSYCSDQERADLINFEGNAQTMRLLIRLQLLAAKGLNLTYGTLSAARKYTASSDKADSESRIQAHKKPGYFASETEYIEEISSRTKASGFRNPITVIVEAADDLVYSLVDIEDALRKGLFEWRDVHEHIDDHIGSSRKLLDEIYNKIKDSTGIDEESKDLNGDEFVQLFRIYGLSLASKAIAQSYADNYDDIMSGSFDTSIYSVSEASDLIRALKDFVRKRVHTNEKVLQLELMGRSVIHGLMDRFHEAVKGRTDGVEPEPREFKDKLFLLLSKNYCKVFSEDLKKHDPQYCQCKLVTDYVCGMTDTFACSVHKQIHLGLI